VAVLPLPVQSGSTQYFIIPPPPNYNGALMVPLPNP